MKFFQLIILSSIILGSTALSVADPKDGIAEQENAKDVEFTNIDMTSGKSANNLGVKAIEDADNNPTPNTAKAPLNPYKESSDNDEEEVPSYNSFLMSISMIIVSEIGDKTFLIAALMAMRNSRFVVFSAAFSSLAIMTVLSGIVGHALPALISQRITQFLASVLFIVFGIKLLREGLSMSKDLGVDEELAEVEEEIASNHLNVEMDNVEGGRPSNNFAPKNTNKLWYVEFGNQIQNLASLMLSPVWIQVFVMTFLGEWGDRSQIATIAMAAGSDYWNVILGAIIGHGVCTAAACIGGKLLATRISMRNVTLGGAIAFFIFAVLYFYDALYKVDE